MEDNLVNQKLALKVLERLGIYASIAGNGLQAVHAAEEEAFDLMLMVPVSFSRKAVLIRKKGHPDAHHGRLRGHGCHPQIVPQEL